MSDIQQDLFGEALSPLLASDYSPRPVAYFACRRIVLAKGSVATAEREAFVRGICGVYPDAVVEERLDVAHNRIDLGEREPGRLYEAGKQTLLFGELRDAVRFSEESANTCPNYWHFSVYGSCPYRCAYCYLAGTQGVFHSPTVKVFVNLPEILAMVDRVANRLQVETGFYHGKLQDGLALDPLTAYSTVLVPFFARHRFARQVILTKSASVERLLNLEHNGHTILSWSLNPPEIACQFERNVPPVEDRIRAMEQCAAAGYPVRAIIMPLIPVSDWEDLYTAFLRSLLERVPIQRLTLGGICSYQHARGLMERQMTAQNAITRHFQPGKSADGRRRYPPALRARFYTIMAGLAHQLRPDLTVSLCMEEEDVWRDVRNARIQPEISPQKGICNCVL